MKNIITLEEIYEIDTITLEEKLQELQEKPKSSAFNNIINLVKLQLIQRQKVQAFGRKLFQEKQQQISTIYHQPFNHINAQSQCKSLMRYSQHQSMHSQNSMKTIKSQTSRKNNLPKVPPGLLQKLKLSTTGSSSYVVIGKPSINHRYVPIKKKEPQKQKKTIMKRNDSRSKKQTQSVPRIKVISNQVKNESKKFFQEKQMKKQQLDEKYQISFEKAQQMKPQSLKVQKELIAQTKIRQIKPQSISIKFIQNDIYDEEEENLVFEQTQNLKDLQKMIDIQVQTTGRSAYSLSECIQQENQSNSIDKLQEQISQQILKVKQKQITLQFANFQENKIQFSENPGVVFQKQPQQIEINYQQLKIQDKIQFPKQQTLKTKSSSFKIIKKVPTSYLKQKIQTQKKQNSNQMLKLSDFHISNSQVTIVKKGKQLINQKNIQKPLKPIQTDRKINIEVIKKEPVNFTKTNFLYSPILTHEIFPYHQVIPNFSKLFPHNKNILITLKNFQINLKGHFQKNVFLYSKNDEYLSLHNEELQFKTITQIQKVNKYSNLFDIDLKSFYQKSDNILKRIKRSFEVQKDFDMLLYRVVRTKQDVYDIISSGFHRTKNWYELPHGMEMKSSWNLLWTWSKPQIDLTDLFLFQKVNHFFGNKQIARKDLLKKNIQKIKKMSKKLAILFDIIPETYFLPGQNLAFIKKFRQYSLKQKLNLWILKPVGLSRGRGIQLVDKLQDVVFSEPVVLQKYLEHPLLLQQRKFDMRIYVLVCSINPLQAYIYKEGFARLSTQKYTTDSQGLGNKFIHLTNYSVQKQNIGQNQNQTKSFEETVGGPKITLKTLKQKLHKIGVQWKGIQKQIDQIVIKSLIACMNAIPQNPNCFQLFGYDIIIDQQHKCWLLEVNSSPSLQKDFIIDQILKQQLIDDVIQVVQPVNYDRQRLKIIVERRRKQAEGLKSHVNFQNNSIQQLNQDMNYILHGAKLKKYGQISSNNNFSCIAPGQAYLSILKAVQQTRIDPIVKNQNIYSSN